MRKSDIRYLIDCLSNQVKDLSDARICELGNQRVRDCRSPKKSKEHFELLHVQHVSIDLNGQDGSLRINLAQSISDPTLISSFHIVTNYGTSEHVSTPPKRTAPQTGVVEAQYNCFRNMHFLLKKDGLFIHCVPPKGEQKWIGHAPVSYTENFFNCLAKQCCYEILKIRIIEKRRLLEVTLKKTKDNDFISIEDFETIISECCLEMPN